MSLRILFISEDDDFTFDMIGYNLKESLDHTDDVKAFSAVDDDAAYKLLVSETIDLILVDFDIKAMNCERFIDMIRLDHRWQHIPMVIMSENKFVERKAFELGVVDFFLKPIQTNELLDKIYATLSPYHELQTMVENLDIKTKDEMIGILKSNIKYITYLKETFNDDHFKQSRKKLLEVTNSMSKNNQRLLNYINKLGNK